MHPKLQSKSFPHQGTPNCNLEVVSTEFRTVVWIKESKEYDTCVLQSRKNGSIACQGWVYHKKVIVRLWVMVLEIQGKVVPAFSFWLMTRWTRVSRFLTYLFFFFESFIHSFPIFLVLSIFHFIYSSNIIFTGGCSIIFTLFAKLVSTSRLYIFLLFWFIASQHSYLKMWILLLFFYYIVCLPFMQFKLYEEKKFGVAPRPWGLPGI